MTAFRLLAGPLLPSLLAVSSVVAQTPESGAPGDSLPVETLLASGDRAHGQLRASEALEFYETALARDSTRYEALWKAAREAVNVGMLSDDDPDDSYRKAAEYARAALDSEPEGVDARHWLSVALGRLALEEGVRTRVRLAGRIRELARSVLANDSLHAGAHHVLGQWHAEVRRLSGFERWFARKLLGGEDFDEASWEEARRHLERAVDLAPGMLIHRIELARIYLDIDRDGLARAQLEEVLVRPSVEPTDPLHKRQAREMLDGLDSSGDAEAGLSRTSSWRLPGRRRRGP